MVKNANKCIKKANIVIYEKKNVSTEMMSNYTSHKINVINDR